MVENTFEHQGRPIGIRTAYFSQAFDVNPVEQVTGVPQHMVSIMNEAFSTLPGEVDVIIGVDFPTGREILVFGRDAQKMIAGTGMSDRRRVLRISIDSAGDGTPAIGASRIGTRRLKRAQNCLIRSVTGLIACTLPAASRDAHAFTRATQTNISDRMHLRA